MTLSNVRTHLALHNCVTHQTAVRVKGGNGLRQNMCEHAHQRSRQCSSSAVWLLKKGEQPGTSLKVN